MSLLTGSAWTLPGDEDVTKNTRRDEDDVENHELTKGEIPTQPDEIKLCDVSSPHDPQNQVSTTTTRANKTKGAILCDVLVISSAFFLLFTSYGSIQNLQSSLNSDKGLGLISLSVVYGAMVIASFCLSSYVIARVGCKITMVVSTACYAVYIASNFYSSWWTLIPASFIVGLAATPLWSSAFSCLTKSALRYASITGESSQTVIARFFGIFYFLYTSSQVSGNLISSLVLQQKTGGDIFRSNADEVCGSNFIKMPQSATNETEPLLKPGNTLVVTMLSVYLAFNALAVLILAVFLKSFNDSPKKERKNDFSNKKAFLVTIRLLKDKRVVLMIPLSLSVGLIAAFSYGDFTMAYVTCAIGIHRVGFVMMMNGASAGISSLFFTRLSKYTGRKLILIAGTVVLLLVIVFLLLWNITAPYKWVIYVVAVVLGLLIGLYSPLTTATLGDFMHTQSESAFAIYNFSNSVGYALSFAYSNYLTMDHKLYILMSVSLFAIVCYLIAEKININLQRSKRVEIPEQNELCVETNDRLFNL